ncbi:MAG TPA: hypothetical protein VFH59_01250 [Frateuria sp.]|uniref:hypothetical protein n=1 Tax=Frateuria sp. TaxID=2211372 RepID=UPI002D7FB25B|nr:hypothetical protein [Frateuria sp.]HET6804054.1 hypothetical protein [Frateuria sp.]
MNHDPRFPLPDDDAGEWAAQERALAEERAGLAPADDAPLRSYRLIAHVLAQPLDAQLPPDFARGVARQVQPVARGSDTGLERGLLALLAAAMAVAALGALVVYGAGWLPALDQGPVGELLTQPWAWTLAVCLGLTRVSRGWWLEHGQPA